MNLKIKPKAIFHYVLLYILLISQGSILFKNNRDIFILIMLIFSMIYLVFKIKNFVNKKYCFSVFILFIFLMITFVATGGDLSIASILNIITSFLYIYVVYDYDKKIFCDRYVRLVTVLAQISLAFYMVQCFNRELLLQYLPAYENSEQIYYGQFFYTMPLLNYGSNRNNGMFAEPGLYQIVLIIGLFFLLFMNKKLTLTKMQQKISLVSILVTIVTAQSTTGYISLVILILFFFLKKSDKDMSRYKKIIVIAILIFVIWDLNKESEGLIYNNFIMKLFNQSGEVDVTVSTGAARYYSMLADMKIALKNPLGIGYNNYAQIWRSYLLYPIQDENSCVGLTRTIASIGWLSSIYVLFFYLVLLKKNMKDMYAELAYIAIFINITLAQPSIFFMALMIPQIIELNGNNVGGNVNEDSLANKYNVTRNFESFK